MKKITAPFIIICLAVFNHSDAQNNYHGIKHLKAEKMFKTGNYFNAPLPETKKEPKLKSSTLIQVMDSLYIWEWDTLTVNWSANPIQKVINIVYDANYNILSVVYQNWNISVWENSYQVILTYNANNNMTSLLQQLWNGTAWDTAGQIIYTYDANNNQTGELYQSWNGTAWDNDIRFTSTYNANNYLTSYLHEQWNVIAWENLTLYVYTYDAGDNLVTRLRQGWNGSAWINDNQYHYTYDANDYLAIMLTENWNASVWVNSSLNTYTYDAGYNLVDRLVEWWDGSAWVSNTLYTYYYDANNNLTGELRQLSYNISWIPSSLSTYTFDADNFMQSETYRYWDYGTLDVEYGDSAHYYFHTAVGIKDLMAEAGSITVYPNPVTAEVTLNFGKEGRHDVQLYNTLGEILFESTTSTGQMKIDVSKLTKGVYFVSVSDEKNKPVSKKFIKM